MNAKKLFKIVNKTAKEILDSKKVVVLTGAGISTESGIPDFRSPGSGIWNRFDADIMSSDVLYSDLVSFYRQGIKILDFLDDIKNAKPNKAHYILAEMEKENLISSIITQNIDGLHLKAGSKKVFEVHGNLKEGYCISCRRRIEFETLVKKVTSGELPPTCNHCGGILRADIVLFGDELPECYIEATNEVESCNLLLVIGSSLEVTPVNSIPILAGKYIIINSERTGFDRTAYIVWHEEASTALDLVYEEIKKLSI